MFQTFGLRNVPCHIGEPVRPDADLFESLGHPE